jgi:hypothetical protein
MRLRELQSKAGGKCELPLPVSFAFRSLQTLQSLQSLQSPFHYACRLHHQPPVVLNLKLNTD